MENTSSQGPDGVANSAAQPLRTVQPPDPPPVGLQLHDAVVDSWGFDIVSGAIPAGRRQSCDELSRVWGVSRTVVREAARVLESKGLLAARRRIGLTVQPSNSWNSMDPSVIHWKLNGPGGLVFGAHLMALLTAVGSKAARLAAANASEEQLSALTNAVVRISAAARSADQPSLVAQVAVFHRTLLRASNNPVFSGLTQAIDEIEFVTPCLLVDEAFDPGQISGRIAVVTAIRSGDGGAAEQAMLALNSLGAASAYAHRARAAPPATSMSVSEDAQPPASRRARFTVV